MFLSPEAVEGALVILQPEDFYRPAHARIFSAMSDLNSRSVPVDHLSVADRLESTGELDSAGGRTYLLDITGVVPIASNWQRYADIVKRMSMLRQLIVAGTAIATMGYDAPDDMDQVVGDAEKIIFDVTNKRVSSNFAVINDLLKVSFKNLEELAERKEHVTGVHTGFKDLDKLLAGLHPGDLCILAARPSVGKTALALNMGVNAARHGASVAVFSLEMGADQLVQRVLVLRGADQPARRADRLRQGQRLVHDPHRDGQTRPARLLGRRHARRSRSSRFGPRRAGSCATSPRASSSSTTCSSCSRKGRRSENRQTEIAEISRGLKILAKELKVPILALSQLSRAVEQRAGKRPQLSDLRESGAIEQDADVVMFIDRNTDPFAEDQEGRPQKGVAELIVAKHRNGPHRADPAGVQRPLHQVHRLHEPGVAARRGYGASARESSWCRRPTSGV